MEHLEQSGIPAVGKHFPEISLYNFKRKMINSRKKKEQKELEKRIADDNTAYFAVPATDQHYVNNLTLRVSEEQNQQV
ncbi:hypothetical protein LOAG_03755 [Loa loa]|uniref:Uncharacterized protein n=1 Tax=Loa loa TaxID=7209 RepID=A0A1S0U5M7_LOALO|nr:hypothetical protein LOAG_03755 [Loa loa]EFO24731.1 hypothetical protein LOAG_03755 [Loa loa]